MPDDADKVFDNVLLTNLIKGLQYSVNKLHVSRLAVITEGICIDKIPTIPFLIA